MTYILILDGIQIFYSLLPNTVYLLVGEYVAAKSRLTTLTGM